MEGILSVVQVKTAEALKAHLSHISSVLKDCAISIERMPLTDDEINWIEQKLDAQFRDIERIRAHARLQRRRRARASLLLAIR